ncbi:MAG: HD domain-containing phosphohydrolase [Methylobacter sp.]
MKIIRDNNSADAQSANAEPVLVRQSRYTWKILVVDDEADIRTLTRISLRDFSFANRSLEFLEASSCQEAIEHLNTHSDIAVALIDVVMETSDAGLKLVEFIREQQCNSLIRLVIRTGQPGVAPERFVIDHYDIEDYKDKTELTASKLYTTLRSALKAYRDLQVIDASRQGLEHVIHATPSIYQLDQDSLSNFFNGMLMQIIGLCQLSRVSHISSLDGVISTIDHGELKIQAYTDQFIHEPRFSEIHWQCTRAVFHGEPVANLREHAEILPLLVANRPVGYIYIEPIAFLSDIDRNLIRIFARQCSQALENYQLHDNIIASFNSAVDMLAEIAEYKDKATGGHVNRLDFYTKSTAMALGVSENQAILFGKDSRLHDVGKVGIPDYILSKPGKLTEEEFEIIKTHTTLGANILGHDPAFELARQIALHHHERWDGKGYPDGILASELPLATRIVSVVDVFDAMISWRPYKQPWSIPRARDAILAGAGTQFDPNVVEAFVELLDKGEFKSVIANAGEVFGVDVS